MGPPVLSDSCGNRAPVSRLHVRRNRQHDIDVQFDFGYGTQSNFGSLEIPYQQMKAYFATHLHTDHVGDFAQIWVGSWTGG